MRINIKYTIEVGGIGGPVHTVIDNGVHVTSVSTWLTDSLCLGFSSLEDLDQAINLLMELKTKTVNKMVSTGHQFVPYKYQDDKKPLIDISVHMHEEQRATCVSVATIDTTPPLDVIRFDYGRDFSHQEMNMFVKKGRSMDIGQTILTEAIRNKVQAEQSIIPHKEEEENNE